MQLRLIIMKLNIREIMIFQCVEKNHTSVFLVSTKLIRDSKTKNLSKTKTTQSN